MPQRKPNAKIKQSQRNQLNAAARPQRRANRSRMKAEYPCPDSNRGARFRKPLLYPPELQGHPSTLYYARRNPALAFSHYDNAQANRPALAKCAAAQTLSPTTQPECPRVSAAPALLAFPQRARHCLDLDDSATPIRARQSPKPKQNRRRLSRAAAPAKRRARPPPID